MGAAGGQADPGGCAAPPRPACLPACRTCVDSTQHRAWFNILPGPECALFENRWPCLHVLLTCLRASPALPLQSLLEMVSVGAASMGELQQRLETELAALEVRHGCSNVSAQCPAVTCSQLPGIFCIFVTAAPSPRVRMLLTCCAPLPFPLPLATAAAICRCAASAIGLLRQRLQAGVQLPARLHHLRQAACQVAGGVAVE